jgi:hypothetical protein
MDIVYFVVGVFSFVVGFLINNFLPSYFNEKGKNFATKEDIKEITDKIESVRFEYLGKLEGVKSELSFSEKQKSRIKEKENEVLLNFFEKCADLEQKLIFNFGNLTKTEEMYPIEYQKYVDNLFYEIRISRQRVFLYLPIDLQIQIKAEVISQHCAEIRNVFGKKFGNYKISLIEESKAISEGSESEYHEAVAKTNKAKSEYDESLKPHYDSFRLELNNFMLEMQKHFAS